MAVRGDARILLLGILCIFLLKSCNGAATDIELDAKAQLLHRLDSLNLLLYTFLLILTVLTIWTFKHRRLRFLHETGLAVIYGLIIGAIIRYGFTTSSTILHMPVVPDNSSKYNQSVPPDTLWLRFPEDKGGGVIKNKTFAYSFRGEIYKQDNEIDLKATFDPEIFFNIILPPIIFHAGYSLKRKYFFRNLGAILMYALIGTSISAFVIGALMYAFVQLIPHLSASFTFLDTLYFGALISPTDPLTIISIFNDLHVDVNLYALVFGESVLNDAVAIVLSGAIQNYGERYQSGSGGFETVAFFQAFGDFVGIFSLSLFIGATMGCITALLTKFTRVRDFPLLESALFVLMSYSTFLIAEASDLTGVVAVLFCGICQAHYTYNNLSPDSRQRTKQLFELLNFLAENFIFSYIGVTMFTFPKHHFDPGFIFAGFLCALLGRAANVYPLSFILNLARKPKISLNYQHMLFFAGLRGAMSFALAIRNTVSDARQAMLTTTSLIVILTVIFQGGATTQFLSWFNIPVGVDEEIEGLSHNGMRSYNSMQDGSLPGSGIKPNEKALLARIWGDFDTRYMKPLLTHSRPTLLETLPVCCTPLARILTTTQQMTQDEAVRKADSDSDFCLEDRELERRRSSIQPRKRNDDDDEDLRIIGMEGFIPLRTL
ncbi:sodium/hydrogen exchanger 7 isoform X7 [Bombus vosnesenskii]|uniref:Sodium/hydrogen exchanger n=4 Tax=Bombus TaxID=28641 RepID=A0A6J3KAF4_9HYME|nr:sodium/hydrogen exchanger 7 isoform X8 [Bombus terrestris]XP_012239335.1 sodium/hydrogen exchanger 7 isoform X8 [Bombus impatiens]XP_033193638.1 sodium/hydrogen exchanger 7 isoform X7 [Bombus vancouverensis nearcticus]XP_033307500.1 sodium/hydrogen exchanger 7 isoform X7 [Bombus bifarius]XP_033350087.1 sodium/hydrogen exchanger 7 isoform X7 [Bombus vosnesenskii]XP_043591053.1 sodium/hydrogen exchanger 7 isoform X8 [Bombus pyrosoma]XP_050477034.1 sodium/hydrogen exchanger 7 isoform X7 [Bomb